MERIKVKSGYIVVSSWEYPYVYSSARIWHVAGGGEERGFFRSFVEAIAEADRRARSLVEVP